MLSAGCGTGGYRTWTMPWWRFFFSRPAGITGAPCRARNWPIWTMTGRRCCARWIDLSSEFTGVTGSERMAGRRGLNHPELVSHFKLGYAGHHGSAVQRGYCRPKQSGRQQRVTSYRVWACAYDHPAGSLPGLRRGAGDRLGRIGQCSQPRRVLQLYGRRTQPITRC